MKPPPCRTLHVYKKITAGCLQACSVICAEAIEDYSHIRDVLWALLAACVNTSPVGSQVFKLVSTQQHCGIALKNPQIYNFILKDKE